MSRTKRKPWRWRTGSPSGSSVSTCCSTTPGFLSSGIADIGLARRVSYAASKGAVLSMTKSMQVDLAQFGIRVNALMPGTILTPFVERYLKESYADPEEGMASIRKRQLSNDLGRPEDVAQAALFLASDESKFMMASGLIIDGGISGAR